MSRLAELSEMERQSWATLIADGLLFTWFWKTMAPGWSLIPRDLDPAQLSSVFVKLVILTIVVHAVIAAVFSFRRNRDEVELDERDLDAQAYGSRIAYTAMYLGVGAITLAALSGYILPEEVTTPFRIETMVHVIFALVLLSYAADLLRNAAMLLRYDRAV